MQPFPYASSVWPYVGGLPLLTASLMDAVCEPFAGSLVLSIAMRPKQIVAAEFDPEIFALWDWIRIKASYEDLTDLESMAVPRPKPMVGGLYDKLPPPMLTLLKLVAGGTGEARAMVQKPGPVSLTSLKEDLPYLQSALRPMHRRWEDAVKASKDLKAFYFFDLPANAPDKNRHFGANIGFVDFRALDSCVKELGNKPWLITTKKPARVLSPCKPVKQLDFPLIRGGGWAPKGMWYSTNIDARKEQEVAATDMPELAL